MTIEEVNTLLAMTLERIDKLRDNLEASGTASKRHLSDALQAHKEVGDKLTHDAVDRAVAREQNKHELEKFEWVSSPCACLFCSFKYE